MPRKYLPWYSKPAEATHDITWQSMDRACCYGFIVIAIVALKPNCQCCSVGEEMKLFLSSSYRCESFLFFTAYTAVRKSGEQGEND